MIRTLQLGDAQVDETRLRDLCRRAAVNRCPVLREQVAAILVAESGNSKDEVGEQRD